MARSPLSGVFAVCKPPGFTSSDVVNIVRKNISGKVRRKEQIKVGHGGTLDKAAEGVLVLGVGSGTKELPVYLKGPKAYRAVGLLGASTNTYDAEGHITETVPWDHVTPDALLQALEPFRGDIMQKPPAYSALKSKGERYSDLAARGVELNIEPRPVRVDRLDLISASDLPNFTIEVECGGGFYVRSLIYDLGKSVGSAAHMVSLVRTRQGLFQLDDPFTLHRDDWTLEKVTEALEHSKQMLSAANHE